MKDSHMLDQYNKLYRRSEELMEQLKMSQARLDHLTRKIEELQKDVHR